MAPGFEKNLHLLLLRQRRAGNNNPGHRAIPNVLASVELIDCRFHTCLQSVTTGSLFSCRKAVILFWLAWILDRGSSLSAPSTHCTTHRHDLRRRPHLRRDVEKRPERAPTITRRANSRCVGVVRLENFCSSQYTLARCLSETILHSVALDVSTVHQQHTARVISQEEG